MILRPHGSEPITVALTPQQMGLVLGLEPLFTDTDSGLSLMCPACVSEHNDTALVTDNAPEDLIWRIDCRCRHRRIERASVLTTMPPSGGLLAHANELLRSASLVVRCPQNRLDCRRSPLTIRPEGQGGWLVACGHARRHFRPKQRMRVA